MTSKEFKKTARILKEAWKELEAEALREGFDIFSETYKEIQDRVRLSVLDNMGFTLDEYREAKERVSPTKKLEEDLTATQQKMEGIEVLNDEDVSEIAARIANEFVTAPVVTHNTTHEIVERTTVEKPTIVKETIHTTEREEYDDNHIMAELGYLNDRLDNLPKPKVQKTISENQIRNLFGELFEHNIDTLGLPDFRKLAMGLQDQIDRNNEYKIRVVSSTDNVKPDDNLIVCNGTFTITLPTAVGFTGEYIIKNTGTGTITVDTTSSQTIDGDLTMTIVEEDSMVVRSNGTNWLII